MNTSIPHSPHPPNCPLCEAGYKPVEYAEIFFDKTGMAQLGSKRTMTTEDPRFKNVVWRMPKSKWYQLRDIMEQSEQQAIQAILDLPMDTKRNDAGASSVREYLKELLVELWRKGEGFSGKRPFGNSGWDYDLYTPLIKAGLITGTFDEEGFLEDVDEVAGHQLIMKAIEAL